MKNEETERFKSNSSSSSTDFTIIGPGALGRSLLAALAAAGGEIRSVVSRRAGESIHFGSDPRDGSGSDPTRHEADSELETSSDLNPSQPDSDPIPGDTGLGNGIKSLQLEELDDDHTGGILFITTPDDAIAEVVERLSHLELNWNERIVAHCSGLLSSKVLQPLKDRGAGVASFHPLQTFTGSADSERFHRIHISVEGEGHAVDRLWSVAVSLGATPLRLDPDQKGILHIAAVFLSNYLVVLEGVADQLIRQHIPGSDRRILEPLLEQTLSNLRKMPPEKALTGPISRGDRQTVEKHLERLGKMDNQNLPKLYRDLGLEAVKLALADGRLDGEQARELKKRLMK